MATNNRPLNIKILKFLDDLELYPSYKVRDIFLDINNPHANDKSLSTVKVHRNPPTSAELADPRRFESLPPESLARPKKRPLPPLFSDTVRDEFREPIDHRNPLRAYSPVLSHGNHKRQKIEEFDLHLYTDPDRPLDSLEAHNGHRNNFRTTPQRPGPPTRQIMDSQKRKSKLP